VSSDVFVDVIRAAAVVDTAPYTQAFTGSLGGRTPKAAIFKITRATADGTPVAHADFGLGMVTGAANEWAVAYTDEDGQATTDTASEEFTDACIVLLIPGVNFEQASAEFSSFSANTVTVNWTDAPAAAHLIEVTLIAGADVSAQANNAALGNTLNNAVDVTGVGFEPDLVLAACRDGTSGGNVKFSFGAVHNGVSVTQRCHAIRYRDNQATSQCAARFTESYGVMAIDNSADLDWGGEFGTFDSDGFTVTTRNAGANNTTLLFLALKFGDIKSWVGTVDAPTSTGIDSQTGPGFRSQFALGGLTHTEAVDTAYTDGRAGVAGVSVFTPTAEYCKATAAEDNQGTTDTQCSNDDTVINLPEHDGTTGHVAAFTSFTGPGWDWNFSATRGTASKWWFATIGAQPFIPRRRTNTLLRM
jgi:hypothetical protein